MKIDIGVFAYNEERNIAKLLKNLLEQLDKCSVERVNVYILANGCTDNTTSVAEGFIRDNQMPVGVDFINMVLPFKGKARTWNHFVHQSSSQSTEHLVFLDADIELRNLDTLSAMLDLLVSNETLKVVSSYPVKDISFVDGAELNLVEKIILSSAGRPSDVRHSICGQLYVCRKSALKGITIPAGLPVEDGFLRAMILTESFSKEEHFKYILCDDKIFHVYESIRSLKELIHHQTRIVIGSSINSVIFGLLRELSNVDEVSSELAKASEDELWLEELLDQRLPKYPHGYIPFHFLIKRSARAEKNSIKSLAKLVMGFCFDLYIYIYASYCMARGKGVGFW